MRKKVTISSAIALVIGIVAGCAKNDSRPTSQPNVPIADSQVQLASARDVAVEAPRKLATIAADSHVPSDVCLGIPSTGAEMAMLSAIRVARIRMEVAAHNIANGDTVGYKRSRVLSTDTGYSRATVPGSEDAIGNPSSAGILIGRGARVRSIQPDMSSGLLRTTGRKLDIAIEGDGYFQVQDTNDQVVYTRCGTFAVNANQQICLCSAGISRLLEPSISIPQDTLDIVISEDGRVKVTQQGYAIMSQIGQIVIVRFINPEALIPLGECVFTQTGASGPPITSNPGKDVAGKVRQGMLEMSNVDLESEQAEWDAAKRSLGMLLRMKSGDGCLATTAEGTP